MSPDHLAELALMETSRWQREAWLSLYGEPLMKKTASHTLHDCYNVIIRAGRSTPTLDYAYGYAREGLRMPDALTSDELTPETRTQALYVRTNLSRWRGVEANAVRLALDIILGNKK